MRRIDFEIWNFSQKKGGGEQSQGRFALDRKPPYFAHNLLKWSKIWQYDLQNSTDFHGSGELAGNFRELSFKLEKDRRPGIAPASQFETVAGIAPADFDGMPGVLLVPPTGRGTAAGDGGASRDTGAPDD